MRKATFLATLVMAVALMTSNGFADTSGSAIMPGVMSTWASSSTYVFSTAYITNISGSDVTCEVTWYDHDGNDVTQYCKVYSGNSSGKSNVLIASGTGTFTLPAGATRFVHFYCQNQLLALYGHAVIKWTSTNPSLRQALIAIGRVHGNSTSHSTQNAFALPINDNKPF